MPHIELLDQITIDKIAAGEVVERPSSVVKELVENAMDAGATAIVVEIEEGGISFIRISDNGCGIARDEVTSAFLRHSTSKIRSADDLSHISTLGFRGEALSSISAVAQVEMITKCADSDFGTKYCIAGGKGEFPEDTGAPNGTTFLVRQLFYNTPARRKFLKTPMTEASHVSDLMTRLALSRPDISFRFVNNKQTKLHTSGNGNLKDVIYHIYGREVANELLPIDYERDGVSVTGFLGKPVINRGNRNFENYFVNGRFVRNSTISKAIEDGYHGFTMQHRYPFVVLKIEVQPDSVDVNVHPTKMELRFGNQQKIYNIIYDAVTMGLHEKPLIQEVELPSPQESKPNISNAKEENKKAMAVHERPPIYHASGAQRSEITSGTNASEESKKDPKLDPKKDSNRDPKLEYFMEKMRERVNAYHHQESHAEVFQKSEVTPVSDAISKIKETVTARKAEEAHQKEVVSPKEETPKSEEIPKCEQISLFEQHLVAEDIRQKYRIIGQVFDTYWLLQYENQLYIIDQHAAHERVLYEKTLKAMKTREFTSQYVSPPIILTLSMHEKQMLKHYQDKFEALGFEFEPFGGDAIAVRAIPDNLFSIGKKDLLMEMLDSLSDELSPNMRPELIDEKIASMSCKAAVKGNNKLSLPEVDALMAELLKLDNPYHCPHGRPTIISMSKSELEKKFKRIV